MSTPEIAGPPSSVRHHPTGSASRLRAVAWLVLWLALSAASAAESDEDLRDGIHRLRWLAPDGPALWSAELQNLDDRLLVEAQELRLAGRVAEARAVLARFLALGGQEPAGERLWTELGGGPVPGLDAEPAALTASPWHPVLPVLEVELLDERRLSLGQLRGKVVVLDFWATWCQPCAVQLPRLQALHDELADQGLVVLPVNVREPAAVAAAFAESLGLRLPIGLYDGRMDSALKVDSLPTVIVLDRGGRLRGRWNGHRDGDEEEIARKVRETLAETDAGPAESIAEVLSGQRLLAGDWTHDGRGRIDGLEIAVPQEGAPDILVASGRFLITFDRDGRRKTQRAIGGDLGSLQAADLDGDGRTELVGYRPGSPRVVFLGPNGTDPETLTLPSPVLDAQLIAAAGERPGQLLLGTISGLFRVAAGSRDQPSPVEGFGTISDLGLVAGRTGPAIVILEPERALSWLDLSLAATHRIEPPPGGWVLVADPRTASGVGVARREVIASAAGRFVPGGDRQMAIALASGQLLLIDLGSGEVRFRARWGSIEHLRAHDLDGDGWDELLVGAGRRLSLVARRQPPK